MYKIQISKNVISSWIFGESEGWDQAPAGFSAENYADWVLIEGEWVQDAEAAALARGEEQEEV